MRFSINVLRPTLLPCCLIATALFASPTGTFSDDLSPNTPLYTLTAIPPLPGNAAGFFPSAINDNGEVVGQGIMRAPNVTIAFLYKDGKTTEIKPSVIQRHGIVNQDMEVNDINDQGQIAGATDSSFSIDDSVWSPSVYHACLVDEKTPLTALPLTEQAAQGPPHYGASHAVAINNDGVCVGHVFSADIGNLACEWRRGRLTLLGTLGGPESLGEAINAKEQVIGDADLGTPLATGGYPRHAFLWTYNGGMRDLGTLGGDISAAECINSLGEIAGYAMPPPARSPSAPPVGHACFWDHGKIYDLGTSPSGRAAIATGINDSGDIVGVMQTPITKQQPYALWHACLWHKGHLYDLNDITVQDGTWGLRSANEDQASFSPFCALINNQGQITGYGVHNGKIEGYLLTPALPTGPSLSTLPSTRNERSAG